jgi:hypothetical protein
MSLLTVKNCVRAALAVAALAGSGLAVAAAPAYPSGGAPTLTNNSLAFIVVYNGSQSYIEYVGKNYADLSASALDASSGFTYQLDAAFDAFKATSGAQPLQYMFFSFDNSPDAGTSFQNIGMRITGTTPSLNLLQDGSAASGAAIRAGIFMGTAINGLNNGSTLTGCALANPCVRTNGQDGYYFGSNNFFSNLGGGGSNTVSTTLGSTLNFFQFLSIDDDQNGDGSQIKSSAGVAYTASLSQAGLFTLTAATGGTQVPLPAAGWLMLSALGGLGAMGRRRKA